MAISSRSFTLGTASREGPRLRAGAALYLGCVVALAVGGGLLGLRLLQTGSGHEHAHAGPAGTGVPVATSFGKFEVESVAQLRGLTPKALAGMTHGIQSLVRADQMQVQLIIAMRNDSGREHAYDPAAFRLRVGKAAKTKTFESVTTTVRAGVLAPRSTMETTIGFVIPRFNPPGSHISLEYLDTGRAPISLDLGAVRRAGATAESIQSLYANHKH